MSRETHQNADRRQQELLDILQASIEDATKDTVLWLQDDPSAEERVHVLAIQKGLADLARIVERRMERRSLPNDGQQWSETVAEVLSRLDKAGEVRGNIVGKGLARLDERLAQELPGPQPRRVTKAAPRSPQKLQSTGIIPGQFAGTRQPPPLYRPEPTQIPPNPYFPPVWGVAVGRGSQEFEETKPKPASSDPATWRSRGDEFKKLADQETQIVRGTQRDRLLADCEFTGHGLLPTPESATVLELRKGPDEHLKVRFEALATRAGMALGCAKNVLPLKFWLYKLFLHLQKTESQHLFAPTHSVQIGSKVSYRAGGIITNVYEASANFCFSLEKQTLEAEHESAPVQNSAKTTQTSKSTTNEATPTPKRDNRGRQRKAAAGQTGEASLRLILEKRGLSVRGWARKANVDFHTADNYLKGKTQPHPDTLKNLADALGLTIKKLKKLLA